MQMFQTSLTELIAITIIASLASLLSIVTYATQKMPHFKLIPILGFLATGCPLIAGLLLGTTSWILPCAIVLGIYTITMVVIFLTQTKGEKTTKTKEQ